MIKGSKNYAPKKLGLKQVDPSKDLALSQEFKYVKGEEKKVAQQVHHVVRTINKNSSFGEDGSIPLQEAENQLKDWLGKGWTLSSAFLVGRNEGQFEICWVLVQ